MLLNLQFNVVIQLLHHVQFVISSGFKIRATDGVKCISISVKSFCLILVLVFDVEVVGPWWVEVYMYRE